MATDGTNYWQAVVWDGDTPGLAVFEMPANRIYSNPLGGGFLKVHDPDVVINYEFADKILVAYEAFTGTTTDVFYEIYSLSTAGISLVQGPTQISTRPLSRHANVDANFIGEAVIVWESNGADIYATTVDLNASFPITVSTGLNVYSSPTGLNLVRPDVSIHGTSLNPSGEVNIIFVEDMLTYTVRDVGTNVSEVFMEIPFYSYAGIENSFATSLIPWKNARSVVDYNGDVCLVCWEFDDSSPVFYRGVNELICHHYYHDGSVFPTSFPDYSAVADGVHGSVSALSLCGALGLAGFAWFENAADEIRIKHSITQLANYRQSNNQVMNRPLSSRNVSFQLYPNPANTEITLTGLNTLSTEVQVMDVYGRVVHQLVGFGTEAKLDIQHLQAGVYFVRINTAADKQVIKFIKQ